MVTSGPESFQCLELRTNFVFASSLDSCVLSNVQKPNQDENQKLRAFKAYPFWEKWANKNQIEVPEEEPAEEDPNLGCGLGVLFKKLQTLLIQHTPRTLTIQGGTWHEFPNTLIGFQEYPFSKAVEAACPPTMEVITWKVDVSAFY